MIMVGWCIGTQGWKKNNVDIFFFEKKKKKKKKIFWVFVFKSKILNISLNIKMYYFTA